MRAGDLRHRLTIQQQLHTQDPASGADLTGEWADVAQVWGSVQPLSSRDLIAAQAAQSQATKRIVIRFRAGIDSTMRILHRGAIYDIVGQPLEDKASGLEYLTILVSVGVTDG